ncbi:MAG: hypothetical protein IPJ31_12900 [Bacteroidetes bacterium]|nr:hypothetical protein [Bacteroidota bacterium]
MYHETRWARGSQRTMATPHSCARRRRFSFSFWNCDVPSNFIHFEATFKNTNGAPVANIDVKIKNTANSTFGYARTNSYGKVDGAIPKNANLILEAYSIICGATYHTQNLTTGTSDITLNNIIINVPLTYQVILSGTILNCTNNICKNGYVKYKIGNTIRFVRGSSNGNFYSSIFECNTPVTAKLTRTIIPTGRTDWRPLLY